MRSLHVLPLLALLELGCSTGGDAAAPNMNPGGALQITPASAAVELGTQRVFQASEPVSWSLAGTGDVGSIAADGTYSAPQTLPAPPTVTLRASSAQYATRTASATIQLVPAGGSGTVQLDGALSAAFTGSSPTSSTLFEAFTATLDAFYTYASAQNLNAPPLTGTYTRQGQTWVYADTPADRMRLVVDGAPDVTVRWTRFDVLGDVNSTQDLLAAHDAAGRFEVAGFADVDFESRNDESQSGSHRYTLGGTLTFAGTTWAVTESGQGMSSFEIDSTGSQYDDDFEVSGTYTAVGATLSVVRRRVYVSVSAGGDVVTQAREWVESRYTENGVAYVFAGSAPSTPAFTSEIRRNGAPSELENWAADGVLTRGGQLYATLAWNAEPGGDYRLVLRDPGGGEILHEL